VVRADEKTAKIVRGRRFGGEEPQPDAEAPEQRAHETPSGLIHDIIADTLEIARAEGKPDQPTEHRLRTNLSTLYLAAQQGAQVVGAVKASRGIRATIGAALALALGIPVGAVGVAATSPDGATIVAPVEAKLDTKIAAHEQRLVKLEAAQTELELAQADNERRARRVQALTVRWLADSQRKHCKALEAVAKAIDPKLEIECDPATLPPELIQLVAQLDIEESTP
jgi:hypothetical protein